MSFQNQKSAPSTGSTQIPPDTPSPDSRSSISLTSSDNGILDNFGEASPAVWGKSDRGYTIRISPPMKNHELPCPIKQCRQKSNGKNYAWNSLQSHWRSFHIDEVMDARPLCCKSADCQAVLFGLTEMASHAAEHEHQEPKGFRVGRSGRCKLRAFFSIDPSVNGIEGYHTCDYQKPTFKPAYNWQPGESRWF